MFFKKKKAKEAEAPKAAKLPTIKAMYVMAFTQPKMDNETLKAAVKAAENLLKEKQPDFKRIVETQMVGQTQIHISNVAYSPLMQTQQVMATTLQSWLKNQHQEDFYPVQNVNFFPQTLVDGQGKEHVLLFYFTIVA